MDRIDVFATARNRAHWSGQIALPALPRLCASLTDGPGDRDGLIHFECQGGIDAQGRPGLRLLLTGVLPLRCDRCAQKLALALRAERDFYFVATQAELAAIPVDDAPDEALLGSGQFDLASLIEDEAILQLPLSPRHADCRPAVVPAAAQAGAAPGLASEDQRPHPFAGLAALRATLHHGGAEKRDASTAPEPAEPAAKRRRKPPAKPG